VATAHLSEVVTLARRELALDGSAAVPKSTRCTISMEAAWESVDGHDRLPCYQKHTIQFP
jgi:hypothetical protein